MGAASFISSVVSPLDSELGSESNSPDYDSYDGVSAFSKEAFEHRGP